MIPYILGSMQKRKTVGLLPEEGRLANHFSKKTPVRRLIRGIVSGNEIYLPDKQSNGMIRNGIGCNCLVDIPEEAEYCRKAQKSDSTEYRVRLLSLSLFSLEGTGNVLI